MGIEQTNQLILLILNSTLMTLLAAGFLGGAWLRQSSLSQQLKRSHLRYQQINHLAHQSDTDLDQAYLRRELRQIRGDRYRLSSQYRWSRIGMLLLHVTVLIFMVSLLALALRSLIAFDKLISTALVLFTIGSAGLLLGTSCILIDLGQGNSHGDSLGHSIGKVVARLANEINPQKVSQSIAPVDSAN